MNFKNLPLVSIIVTTKNEEKNVGSCLASLKRQSYLSGKMEVMVVDNNSTDKTKEIAQRYTDQVYNYPNLSDFAKVKNFRGAQLNFGVRKSQGEIIFFPDADMTFDKKLIEEAVELIGGGEFEALYVPETIIGKGIFGKVRNFERSFYNETVLDALRIIKKTTFEKAGGYDEKNIVFGADDWDFTKEVKKITRRVSITQSKLFHHEEGLDLKTFLLKKRKYVRCFDDYLKKWGGHDPDIKKQLGLFYRSVTVFTENGKWKKLIVRPHLAVAMYLIRFVTWLSFATKL